MVGRGERPVCTGRRRITPSSAGHSGFHSLGFNPKIMAHAQAFLVVGLEVLSSSNIVILRIFLYSSLPPVLEHLMVVNPRHRFINVKMLTIWAIRWLENGVRRGD